MVHSDQRLLDILDFWHKTEFFVPFDLDNRARSQSHRKKLWRSYGDVSALASEEAPEGFEVVRYTLFLGVFDKAVVRGIPKDDGALAERDRFDEDQKARLEGQTCMASIDLSPEGVPVFDSFAISTLPWAIGQSRTEGIGTLSSGAFQSARMQLSKDLYNFATNRLTLEEASEDQPRFTPVPLAPGEVESLIDLLSAWSGFQPGRDHPAALLDITFGKKRAMQAAAPTDDSSDTEDEGEEEDELVEIGILNSFFIEDIERAMAVVKAGETPRALRQYLTPLPAQERLDLYTEAGRDQIVAALSPARQNAGRWFANPDHAMSLMQQFAINAGMEAVEEGGLFSINGPPGTGKTTLLRDVVADNVTRRAAVLARLMQAGDAFQSGGRGKIAHLVPELTGFEMVVASSNNAAVENISRDLPKRRSVWGTDIRYLQPVAHKLAAQEKTGRCRRLVEDDRPWGLIAAAMGKKANRSDFVDRVFFNKIPERARPTWSGAERPVNIWQWREAMLADPTPRLEFKAAQSAFKAAQDRVVEMTAELLAFDRLAATLRGHDAASWCQPVEQAVGDAEAAYARAVSDLHGAEQTQAGHEAAHLELKEEERLLGKAAPAWWRRLLHMKDARAHKAWVARNAEAQISRNRALKDGERHLSGVLRPAVALAQTAHVAEKVNLERVRAEWEQNRRDFAAFKARFGGICPPENRDDLETDARQIDGLWHTREFATLRANLFQSALALQEAWLLAVLSKGGKFVPNLIQMPNVLQNRFEGTTEDERAVWQSVFMIVPVISSTFASIARQFENLGTGSLGWLFIDEAGQAVPQSAVGAILRAKRVLAIGDPLQIEPVFTLPKKLVQELAQIAPQTADGSYSPDVVSVQILADRANRFGTRAPSEGAEDIWIGSPLRVHRRCVDPMFSIANTIAYNERMVFGLPSRTPENDETHPFGASCWVDFPGTVVGRQAVPEQVDFVAQLIARFYMRSGAWPELYVISPFKEVKERLAERLQARAVWEELGAVRPNGKSLATWVSARIGTVHTFQGKEEDTVIMLLGADAQTEGAVRWAASKPNLLNVALTRAKRSFYVIGDREIWGRQRYFQEVYRKLPTMDPEAFAQGGGAQ